MRNRIPPSTLGDDPSGGWEAIADKFLAARSNVGAEVVREWSRRLAPGAAVVDIGCGSGAPVSEALIAEGFTVFGIDASPTLLVAFRRRFPNAETACERAESSRFFDRKFDGAVAVGLMFLLSEDKQWMLIERVGKALTPGGRFLFSAPAEACAWQDTLTGRSSLSLGSDAYERLLGRAGLRLETSYVDAGENHYFGAVCPSA